MSMIRILLAGALTLSVATAWGQSRVREAHIGYLYPGGGKQGTSFRVTVAGQFLRGAREVYVSGNGVHASVIKYIKPLRNLNKDQRDVLRKRLREVSDKRLAELGVSRPARRRNAQRRPRSRDARQSRKKPGSENAKAPGKRTNAQKGEVKLPDHPLFYEMENKSLRELAHLVASMQSTRGKRQLNRQLAEWVLIKITVDADAPPGDRELRIAAAAGLTNPMVFKVGVFPEVCELEPNNRQALPDLPRLPGLPDLSGLLKVEPHDLPVVFNGQILPGDVDRFRFRARHGQRLVIEAQARRLIPYLADAVPGWFQATLALYDARGKEVAFVDDYRFHPDPILLCWIPEDGEYELEIRDAIYRGREDFVYRIAVGEQPFITQIFPLGGREGIKTAATVKGWNLPRTRLPLDTGTGGTFIRTASFMGKKGLSNAVTYAVNALPECNEKEYNGTPEKAQAVDLPMIVNGRIGKAGDVDVFCFQGRGGEKVVAEVYGRRLNSPVDSLLRLTDASGRVLAWNDDHVVKEGHLHKDIMGLTTHHADSYLMAELPGDGTYYVHLSDSQHQGSGAHGYRLRITPPQPDFALRMTPSSLSMRGGATVPIHVHVLRKDGFNGEIEVVVEETSGFVVGGGRIPAGRNHLRMTLKAPRKVDGPSIALELQGRAQIHGKTVSHRVVPAEDMMQAFLYRHLVPSQELRVAVRPVRWRTPPVEVAGDLPVQIPAGGTARVRIKGLKGRQLRDIKLALKDPPAGVTLQDVSVALRGLAFRLKVEKGALPVGYADNLIVEIYRESVPRGRRGGKASSRKQRFTIGILPALPIVVVDRRGA